MPKNPSDELTVDAIFGTRKKEMIRNALLLAIVLLSGSSAFAQDYARIEVPVVYSFIRFNPQHAINGFSLNGVGSGFAYYFNPILGFQVSVDVYGSLNRTFTFPAGGTACVAACTINAKANLLTYHIGPIFKFRVHHLEPFAEAMLGGAHSNVYANLAKACELACPASPISPHNDGYSYVAGIGLDIPLSKSIAVRPAQFDLVSTRFSNRFTNGPNAQYNFRYNAGIIFRF